MLASLGAAGAITGLSSHLVTTAGVVALGAAALVTIRRNQLRCDARHRQELALRKELLAYLLFNGSPRSMAAGDLGRQISRLIAVRSSFGRAALILRNETGTLSVAGSAGFDDLSVQALNRWGERVSGKDVSLADIAAGTGRAAGSSFTLTLDRRSEDRNPLSTMSCKSVHMVPLRTARGIVGALVVSAEPRPAAKAHDPRELIRHAGSAALPLADLLQPLEALALRLTMQLAAPENVTPIWPARTSPRQDRHTRATTARDRQLKSTEGTKRRSVDTAMIPFSTLSTGAALDRVREVLSPSAAPIERTAGVSGRPPARLWRPTSTLFPSKLLFFTAACGLIAAGARAGASCGCNLQICPNVNCPGREAEAMKEIRPMLMSRSQSLIAHRSSAKSSPQLREPL